MQIEATMPLIFGLPAIVGLIPLLIFIVGAFRKNMNLVVLVYGCVIVGAILTCQTPKSIGTQMYASLGSFLGLVGMMIMSGSGLGTVLHKTGVADNIVHFLVSKVGVKTQSRAILSVMVCTVTMTTLLGTLAGANAVIAPIIISLVAAVGLTPWTVAVLFQGSGQAGLFLSPVSASTVTLMGITGMSYPKMLLFVGLPIAITMNVGTFFIARHIQKKSEGKVAYTDVEAPEGEYKPTPAVTRSTAAFIITMVLMVVYGVFVSGGAAFAVIIMMVVAVVTGLCAGLNLGEIVTTFCEGCGKMIFMFIAMVGFDMMITYINGSGGFATLVSLLEPIATSGGKLMFAFVTILIGVFGIGGTAPSQAMIIDQMFRPIVESMGFNVGVWGMILLVGSQITSFAYPGNDMVAAMALARCDTTKPMLEMSYKWIIPATIVITLIWTLLFA